MFGEHIFLQSSKWFINREIFIVFWSTPTNAFPSNTAQVRHIYLKLTVVFS